MTPEDLQNYQFSYVSKEVMLLLLHTPSLVAVAEIRSVLDLITDSLIEKNLEKLNGIS